MAEGKEGPAGRILAWGASLASGLGRPHLKAFFQEPHLHRDAEIQQSLLKIKPQSALYFPYVTL